MAASLTAVLDDRLQFQSPWFIFNFWEPCYIYLVFSQLGLSTSLYTKFNVSCNSLPNSLFTCSKITQYSFRNVKVTRCKIHLKKSVLSCCKNQSLQNSLATLSKSYYISQHHSPWRVQLYKLMDNRKLIVFQKSCGLILSLIPMLQPKQWSIRELYRSRVEKKTCIRLQSI